MAMASAGTFVTNMTEYTGGNEVKLFYSDLSLFKYIFMAAISLSFISSLNITKLIQKLNKNL